MTPYLTVAVAVLSTALLLVIQHWLVQHTPGPYPVTLRYAMGSLAVLLGFGLWAFLEGQVRSLLVLATIYCAAGGLIVFLHLIEGAVAGEAHKQRADFLEARHTGEDNGTPA